MKNNDEHNELDQFLREKFEGHTIEPGEELWKGIEQRFAPQVVTMQKYSRLKLALYSSAVVIAGLVVMLFVLNAEKSNLPEEAANPVVKKLPENNLIQTETKSPKEKEVLQNSITGLHKPSFATSKQQTETIEPNTVSENTTHAEESAGLYENKMSSLVSLDFRFPDSFQTEELTVPDSPVVLKSSKPAKSKKPSNGKNKNNYSGNSKRKHISAKDYYARQSKSGGSIKPGFFDNFDLKLVATPSFTTRSLNNLQNVQLIEYDQKFFKEIESPGFVLNGGLELSYQINNRWSMYSGSKLFYYLIHVKTDNTQYSVINQNQLSVPTSAGNVTINGEGIGNPVYPITYYTKLKLRYFDIPLVARYYFNRNIYLDAGLKYSFLLGDKTQVSRNDSDAKVLFDKITGLQKNNFGLVLGTGFEHVTRSGIKFGVGPELTLNLNNMNPTAEVIGKPISFGIKASLYLRRYN